MANLTILAPSTISWSTAESVFALLLARNHNIHIISSPTIIRELEVLHSKNPKVTFHNINDFKRKAPIRRIIHQLVLAVLTPPEFSSNYTHYLQCRVKRIGRFAKPILWVIKQFPKCEVSTINAFLDRMFGPVSINQFPTSNILVVSEFTSQLAHLLLSPTQRRVTVLESWDHPYKSPIGYASHHVCLWNEHLSQAWNRRQGSVQIHYTYPYKLGYIFRRSQKATEDRYWLYPATFSEHSNEYFTEELRLLEEICKSASALGQKIYIKPKPNGNSISFSHLTEKFSNVILGTGQNSRAPSEYRLDAGYNQLRLDELSQASVVFNLGTTFAFEAAAFGIPVYQLLVDAPQSYPFLSRLKDYPHLRQHIYSKDELVFRVGCADSVRMCVLRAKEPEHAMKARRFTAHLTNWITPRVSQDVSDALIAQLTASRAKRTEY